MIQRLYKLFFQRVTIDELKQQELYTAQCAQLQAQTQLEYYTAMVEFNRQRIQRLKPLLETVAKHNPAVNSNSK